MLELYNKIQLIMFIPATIGWFMIFSKAKQPAYYAVIPFLNTFTYAKIVYGDRLGWVGLLGALSLSVPEYGGLLYMVFAAYTGYWLVKSFDGSTIMAITAIFLPWLMIIVIGFSSAEYIGNKEGFLYNIFG